MTETRRDRIRRLAREVCDQHDGTLRILAQFDIKESVHRNMARFPKITKRLAER